MTRRALLIGAPGVDLPGVLNDVEMIRDMLHEKGFLITPLTGADATRARILAAYETLIGDVRADDSVVVYYAGHGGRVAQEPPAAGAGNLPVPVWQFICPQDMDQTAPGDFRGITSAELTVLHARISERTNNSTSIRDCCHASGQSRDPDLVPRGRKGLDHADITAHHAAVLDADDRACLARFPEGAPGAVRLAACAAEELALEYTETNGEPGGLFTRVLCEILKESEGTPLSWATLFTRVRQRTQYVSTSQNPVAEGAARRLPFSLTTTADGAVPVTADRNRAGGVTLNGGRLAGIEVDDTFTVMPAGAEIPDPATQIGIVTVTGTDAATARGTLAPRAGATLTDGAVALPRSRALSRWPVAVTGNGSAADAVRAAVNAAPNLRSAAADDHNPLVTVEVTGSSAVLADRAGVLTPAAPVGTEPAAVGLVRQVTRLAKAAELRLLPEDPRTRITEPFDVEFGLVHEGRAEPFAGQATLAAGQRIYVRVVNRSRTWPLYFYFFDIGLAGRITQVSRRFPNGAELHRDEELVFGQTVDGTLSGLPLTWPGGLPEGLPRTETLMVIVTTAPENLSALTQDGLGNDRGRRGEGSHLRQWLQQIGTGTSRDVAEDDGQGGARPVSWSVRRAEILLTAAV